MRVTLCSNCKEFSPISKTQHDKIKQQYINMDIYGVCPIPIGSCEPAFSANNTGWIYKRGNCPDFDRKTYLWRLLNWYQTRKRRKRYLKRRKKRLHRL